MLDMLLQGGGMHTFKLALASVALCAMSAVATAGVASADNGQGQNQNQQGGTQNGQGTNQQGQFGNISPANTPELDSLLLFGSGIVGVAGYVALRRRASR
jgi:hypothetical protein